MKNSAVDGDRDLTSGDSGRPMPFSAHWRRSARRTVVLIREGNTIAQKKVDIWDVTLVVNNQVIVGSEGLTRKEGESRCWDLLQSSVRHRCTDLRAAANAISAEMRWSLEEGLAVAYAFSRDSLGCLRFAGLVRKPHKGRGRPMTVDRTTLLTARFAMGWEWLTGRAIGFSESGWLTRSIEAAAPYFAFTSRRGTTYGDMRGSLRDEFEKYKEGRAVWAPTLPAWRST